MISVPKFMKSKIVLNRKHKYLAVSILLVGTLFWFSSVDGADKLYAGIVSSLVATVGVLFLQYSLIESSDMKGLIYKTVVNVVTLPAALTLGTLFSLYYFPNLSLFVKLAAIVAVGVLMYISLLVNNIFLVVHERGEIIPLFRVASTWSQILIIVVSIPFFSGIYKLPFLPFFQSGAVALTAILFSLFLGWVQNMDPDVPKIDKKTKFIESVFVGFMLGGMSIATSFTPTESFLRALLMSSLLMFGLGYTQAHQKNAVTKKLMVEYALITSLFLAMILIFKQI